MRIKLDENLSVSVAAVFRAAGHDVDTVVDEQLTGAADRAVLDAATNAGRLVVTLDRGFGDVRSYPPGSHAGVLVLRVEDQSPPAVERDVQRLVGEVDVEALSGCVAVLRDGALRVRRTTGVSREWLT